MGTQSTANSLGIYQELNKLHGHFHLIAHSQICALSRVISELFLFVFTDLALASHASSCLMNWLIYSRISTVAVYLPGLIHHAPIEGRISVCLTLTTLTIK